MTNEAGKSMRRSIVFATDVLEPLISLSRVAEQAGFDRVWTTEYPGRDAIARALAIALSTDRIGVGTGVAYAFSRPPLAMAALASDVHRLSHERFALGISAGTRGVRRWYGAEFDPPAPRMREYVAALHSLWEQRSVYPVRPRVYLPAFQSVMTRHASAVSDGLLLHPLAALEAHLHARVLPAVAKGSVERTAPLDLVAWQITSIDPDEEAARRRAAAQIAFYFSTPSYAVAVQDTEWASIPARVRDSMAAAGGRPDWDVLGRGIPDSLIDELVLVGRPDDVARRLAAVEDRLGRLGVSELVLQTVGAGLSEDEVVDNCSRIIRAAARGSEGSME